MIRLINFDFWGRHVGIWRFYFLFLLFLDIWSLLAHYKSIGCGLAHWFLFGCNQASAAVSISVSIYDLHLFILISLSLLFGLHFGQFPAVTSILRFKQMFVKIVLNSSIACVGSSLGNGNCCLISARLSLERHYPLTYFFQSSFRAVFLIDLYLIIIILNNQLNFASFHIDLTNYFYFYIDLIYYFLGTVILASLVRV